MRQDTTVRVATPTSRATWGGWHVSRTTCGVLCATCYLSGATCDVRRATCDVLRAHARVRLVGKYDPGKELGQETKDVRRAA